jgi:uncharacterized protein with PQ loop repeat
MSCRVSAAFGQDMKCSDSSSVDPDFLTGSNIKLCVWIIECILMHKMWLDGEHTRLLLTIEEWVIGLIVKI